MEIRSLKLRIVRSGTCIKYVSCKVILCFLYYTATASSSTGLLRIVSKKTGHAISPYALRISPQLDHERLPRMHAYVHTLTQMRTFKSRFLSFSRN